MASEDLVVNAETHNDEFPEEWAISVACAPGLTAGAMVRQSGWIRNNAVRLSTVGQVRAIGHDVIPSGKFPHADLKLCEEPSDALWEELRSVFSAPIKKSELPS